MLASLGCKFTIIYDPRERKEDRAVASRIAATTPAGKLQMHILGAIAEFERARIAERVKAGLKRAKSQGQTLGRPRLQLPQEAIEQVRGLSVRAAARKLCISPSAAHRLLYQKPS